MVNINYQKRKNQELFKSFEKQDTLFLSKTQNYIPIYKKFFNLNDNNYNSINLNHQWYISNIYEKIEDNPYLFQCSIKNIETQKIKDIPIFFKFAPILDPCKYLTGKDDITDEKMISLPDLKSDETNSISKIVNTNNSAYIDGFFLYLTSQLLHTHSFIHGIDYYGSFLSVKNDYKLNVFDDLEYLVNFDFFNKNKNVLFKIDDYSHLFSDDNPVIKPIVIDHSVSVKSNLSIKSLNNDLFNDVFESDNNDNNNLFNELEDISEMNILKDNDKTTTLKTSSTCSSRTSLTSLSEDNDCDTINDECIDDELSGNSVEEVNVINKSDEEVNENEDNCDDNDDGEWEDISEENETLETEEEEEEIFVTIQKFPVQVICMEYCENTFDDLISNDELTNEEWLSALMQIIMILITYQKTFAFTHNDLHTNNVMYNNTKKKFIYYKYKNILYKVPTFGRLFKIIDFGRSIYKFNGNLLCSDSFQNGGDASTQYNFEPYFNKNKPRLEPNYSFDLCRLACSIFDYLVDDLDEIKDLEKLEPFKRLIVEWCLDDKGVNMLYKNNGSDRYPDFKLYKMIARHVHNHTPQLQLERPEFKSFICSKNNVDSEKIIDIDSIPVFV